MQLGLHRFHGCESSNRQQWSCDEDQHQIESSIYSPLQKLGAKARFLTRDGKGKNEKKYSSIVGPVLRSEMGGRQPRTTAEVGTQLLQGRVTMHFHVRHYCLASAGFRR